MHFMKCIFQGLLEELLMFSVWGCPSLWSQVQLSLLFLPSCPWSAVWSSLGGVGAEVFSHWLFFQVGLRQQDMSLLCQLWSLHESIQEYKGSCQDLTAGSSADGTYENGFFDEDEEYYQDSSITPTEQPDGSDTSPQNGSAKDKWLHDSFHITI